MGGGILPRKKQLSFSFVCALFAVEFFPVDHESPHYPEAHTQMGCLFGKQNTLDYQVRGG